MTRGVLVGTHVASVIALAVAHTNVGTWLTAPVLATYLLVAPGLTFASAFGLRSGYDRLATSFMVSLCIVGNASLVALAVGPFSGLVVLWLVVTAIELTWFGGWITQILWPSSGVDLRRVDA